MRHPKMKCECGRGPANVRSCGDWVCARCAALTKAGFCGGPVGARVGHKPNYGPDGRTIARWLASAPPANQRFN